MNLGMLCIFLDQSLQQNLNFIGRARHCLAIPSPDTDQGLDVFERMVQQSRPV